MQRRIELVDDFADVAVIHDERRREQHVIAAAAVDAPALWPVLQRAVLRPPVDAVAEKEQLIEQARGLWAQWKLARAARRLAEATQSTRSSRLVSDC